MLDVNYMKDVQNSMYFCMQRISNINLDTYQSIITTLAPSSM
jgi:hypothetical protein